MAAFLALSFLFGFAGEAEVSIFGGSTGFDFCASRSGKLMLAVSSPASFVLVPCFSGDQGICELLKSGRGPAMEVSGMPLFRGGGEKSSGRE